MASQVATTPTIKIAEIPLARVRTEQSAHSTGAARSDSSAGGIYHARASLSRRSISRPPQDQTSATAVSGNDIEEGDNWRDDHVRTKQVFRGTTLLWYALPGVKQSPSKVLMIEPDRLAYQSVGVIYGDIGTRSALTCSLCLRPRTDNRAARSMYSRQPL